VNWELITAPDEQERCCVVRRDRRCEQASTYRVASVDGWLDDYAYVCADDVQLVSGPGYVVTRVERFT
jgi:hypothetical protein